MTRVEGTVEEKRARRGGRRETIRKGETAMRGAIRGDSSVTDSVSPRDGGVQREYNSENIYQVLLNGGRDEAEKYAEGR